MPGKGLPPSVYEALANAVRMQQEPMEQMQRVGMEMSQPKRMLYELFYGKDAYLSDQDRLRRKKKPPLRIPRQDKGREQAVRGAKRQEQVDALMKALSDQEYRNLPVQY